MGSFTSGVFTNPVHRLIIGGNAVVGDQIIVTIDGLERPYTVQAADLDANGSFWTAGATALAAAINAGNLFDPISGLQTNEVYLAKEGLGNNIGVRFLLWVGISMLPGTDRAMNVSSRFVPVNAGAQSPVENVQTREPDRFFTVTDPLPAGAVLTATVNAQAVTYTVAAGDTATSIAQKLAILLTNSRLYTPVLCNNVILMVNGSSAGELTLSASMTPPPAPKTLTVSGRFLNDRKGNKLILRGVDYPLADDGQFPGGDYLNEILQTGANAIRIQWYMNYSEPSDPERPPTLTPEALGGFLDRCIAANIVPIVMLADLTCNSDTTLLNSVIVPWWTRADVLAVMQARAPYLILNLANELGDWQWVEDPATALTTYVSSYKTAIASMRAAGYAMPLMIDAPDGGARLDAFLSVGSQLIAADPLGNILLSVHAYWAGYTGTTDLAVAIAQNLPIVFGEIANKQDEVVNGQTVYGYYDLDGTQVSHAPATGFTYQPLLQTLVQDEVGWMAWCWYNDFCGARQMTSNGTFASLTPYGSDLVNNPAYGLKATAVRVTG